MDKTQLQEIFKAKYNTETWQQVLIDVFGATALRREPKSLDNDNNDKVEGVELGKITTPDHFEIGLYEFEIKKKHKLSMNRVGLRGLVKSFTRFHVDAALVVYYDAKEWRLSFICDLKEEKTAPKRFSYLFGSNAETYRTPIDRFTGLMQSRGDKTSSFEAIREAFSVEKLGKDFFREYKDQYKKFVAHISKTDSKNDRDYCKKLLGRLVFLQFVQKKKWLGGDLNFMRNLFAQSKYRGDFLKKVLEPLFFDTLNTPRQDDIASDVLGADVRIPYLNGGLFEKDKLDETTHNFPPSYFEELFDFFGQYNFTIDENDPNDAEVGIDPEMLGHIFENLLEDNKDKGAFYTPKEIVQYMSRESLGQYLKSHTEESIHDLIDRLINRHEIDVLLQDKDVASRLNTLLVDVKICDPAIGSGAFPMGILNEIFAIRKLLFPHLKRSSSFPSTDIKKEIIQNNIYGVDIEQGAVDIARLRFWLSLVVEEQNPEPLPNLDYKIMQGNSLLESFEGVDLSFYREKGSVSQGTLDFGGAEQTQSEIKELIHEYFAVTDHVRKVGLRNEIDAKVLEHIRLSCTAHPGIVEKLASISSTNRPFFLWHVYFNDVFERGGFDIVIANPPYVEAKKLKEIGSKLKPLYDVYSGTADLSCYFIERGVKLCRDRGIMLYITTNKFFNTGYGKSVRSYLRKNSIQQMIDFEQVEVFENTLVSSVVLGVIKESQASGNIFKYQKFYKLNHKEFIAQFVAGQNTFGSYSQDILTDDEWSFANNMKLAIKAKIENISNPLKDLISVSIYRGITTGYNPAFIISNEQKEKLISQDQNNVPIIKNLLQGRNIRKWYFNKSTENLLFTKQGINIEKYPSIKDFLTLFYEELKPRKEGDDGDTGRKPGTYQWFEIQDNTAYYLEFEDSEKIIWGLTANKWAFAYDNQQHYLPSNGYMLTSKIIPIKYLLAILNSNLIKYYFGFIGVMTAGGAYTLKHATIQKLPIKIIDNQLPFINIVDQILEAKRVDPKADTSALEAEIDTMVYALYGLSQEEIVIIEK